MRTLSLVISPEEIIMAGVRGDQELSTEIEAPETGNCSAVTGTAFVRKMGQCQINGCHILTKCFGKRLPKLIPGRLVRRLGKTVGFVIIGYGQLTCHVNQLCPRRSH
ncbi:unnamed protein product [Lepeophtheirus salmonis]|uniref:(salmon louse) hypothetical protein n=1 Tax=Lepeophtheirus salmonis TaxID=72036 RepID=A0A7R8CIJ8_LEPSM|nr:unnamed protein product [Lepeophtheirus salmonis]CAF2801824.1 unnamed protein product [Lepeophtheirus salmonis]